MLDSSAGTSSKHLPGIQPLFICSGLAESNCRKDGGIKNEHGV
jgi:hypothetical protein